MTTPITLTEEQRDADVAECMRDCMVNSDAATRVVDTLAKYGFTLRDMPGPDHGDAITLVLAELGPSIRVNLCDYIAGRNGWPKWLENAFHTIQADDQIRHARTDLRDKLAAAESAVRDAIAAYDRLTGPLYDIEYEGEKLIPHHLDQAHLAIRTAVRLNPRLDD